jgi:hypothetical protein
MARGLNKLEFGKGAFNAPLDCGGSETNEVILYCMPWSSTINFISEVRTSKPSQRFEVPTSEKLNNSIRHC